MARRKRRRRRRTTRPRTRRRKDKRVPLATIGGILAGTMRVAPSGRTLIQDLKAMDFDSLIYDAREIFAGIDANGKFQPIWLLQTYGPMVLGGLISKFVGPMVNRHMAKIPFVGKYIKI